MPNSIAVSRTPESTTSVARAFGVVNALLERDPTGEISCARGQTDAPNSTGFSANCDRGSTAFALG